MPKTSLLRLLAITGLAALLLGHATQAFAATCTSYNDGNWNGGSSVWTGCTLTSNAPPAGSTVIIGSGKVITVTSSPASVASITINSGSTLRVSSGVTLTLTGNFTNNGIFTGNSTYSGTVAFAGTTQSITGTTTFYRMSVGASTVLTLHNSVAVTSTLTGTPNLARTCPVDYTLTNGSTVYHSCVAGCSAYRGQATINELRIGASKNNSTSNQVEIFNSGNVASSVWKTWKILIYYSRSGTTTAYGPYALSGFVNNGQFIYNSTTAMYMRNRTGRSLDIALVDSAGDFIDYIALGSTIQGVPPCMGSPTVVTATSGSDRSGDLPRLPDGGSWPGTVTGTSSHTIGQSNMCTVGGKDLVVSNSVDSTTPTLNTTTVNYTVTVLNKSCSPTSITSVSLTDTGITTANFSSLVYTAGPTNNSPATSTSVTAPGASAPVWTIGTLQPGASATLTISGKPTAVGALTATATATAPGNTLVNTADDKASVTINVHDFNYVGFAPLIGPPTVTEGVDLNYTLDINADVPPAAGKSISISYTVTGTGSGSSDIVVTSPNPLTIDAVDAAGDPNTLAQISFNILDDSIYEPPKSIVFTITGVSSSDGSAKLDTPTSSVTLTLLDDEMAPLVAEYHLDDGPWTGAAGEVEDSSGKGHHGVAVGSTGLPLPVNTSPALAGATAGTCGYGKFAGLATKQAISLGAVDLGLGGASGLTVSAWVRWGIDPSSISNVWPNIASNGDTGTTGQFWLQHSSDNKRFELAVRNDASPFVRNYVQSKTAPVQGQWQHVVGVFDGSALHIYVNGVLDDSSSIALSGKVTAFSSQKLYIGTDSSNSRPFPGDIDEVKVFSGALTAAQIASLYAETHPCPPVLVDHIRIEHDGQALSCQSETLTVKACSDAEPTCTLYTGGISGNVLAKSGNTVLATMPFTITSGSGTATVTLPTLAAQVVSFETSALSVTPTGASAWTCWDGSTASCSMAVSACPSGGFNCLDSSITPYSGATARLYTKLAGTGFSVDVVPLDSTGAQESNFVVSGGTARSVTVELVDGSGATACASRTAISPAVSQSLSFASTDSGRKTASLSVNKAYTDLRCRVTDANQSPTVVSCSSDNFSVRPGAVTLATTPSMATPPSASAAGTLKTGAAFTLSASTSTSAFDGYSGSLARDASKFSAQTTAQDSSVASGGVVGTLTAPSLTANAVTANNASYDEVGYLYLSAGAYADTSFTTVDQGGDCVAGSTSASAIGGKYGCVIGNSATVSLGRFIPDHFDVAVASQGAMAAACLAGGFTYTGQPMVYGASTLPTLSIKPMSAASGGHVTQNYQGVFQKLTSAGVSITLPTTDATQLGKDGAAKTLLTTTAGSATLSNSGGTLSYARGSTESFTFTRDANSLVAPYTSGIALAVTGVADGEVVATGSLPTLSPTGTSMRYGRLRLQNAYGSERLALPVPLEAQYWAGNYYVTNSNDSCTVIPMSAIVMDNYKSQLNACETRISPTGSVTLSAGKLPGTGLLLSAPGVGNSGSVDLTLNLTASASGNTCLAAAPAAATAANLPWFGANPTARATFGIFKSPLIYRRENY